MTPDRRSVVGALRERWASLLDVTPFSGKEISLALAIAAVGFVATALIAFAGSASRGQPAAVQTVNVPGPTVYVTVTPSAAPQPTNTAQPTVPATPAPTVAPSTSTTTTTPAPAHAVWHKGDVTITPEAGADLDAPADDPTWGQLANGNNPLTNGGPYDVWWRGGILSIDPIRRQGLRIKAAPTFATCLNPGYSNDPTTAGAIGPIQLRTGYVFCVQTDGGRLSVLSYKSLPGGSVQLHVITWAKAGD